MRPYPRLLHPVTVSLEQIDRAATLYDDDTRAPLQQAAYKARLTISGQASYGSSKDYAPRAFGRLEQESGFVTFLQRDLEARSITLNIGDRIVAIGNTPHNVFITRLQPMGHYPEYGNTLVRAYYQDRQPAKAIA